MSDTIATKEEAQKVFNKLKQNSANQVCFDCENRNPTWTSIPFGVLLCMECSAVHRNMGVHISFVKSSNLDSWQRIQLRNFKFGGNHVAKEFFTKNGGSQYLNKPMDANSKYTSNVAKKYKEKLKQKALEDANQYPDIVTLDDINDNQLLNGNGENNAETNDFFSNWSKPINATPSPLSSKNNTPNASTDDLSANTTKKPAATRTTTSRLNRSTVNNGTGAKKSILSSKGNGPRSSRLQNKRINKTEREDIDFDEIEKKAKQEAEEMKQLGYNPNDNKKDDVDDIKFNNLSLNSSRQETPSQSSGSLNLNKDKESIFEKEKLAAPAVKDSGPKIQKLGFGMTQGDNVITNENKKKYEEVKYTGEVSNKFGTQKGISSDEFFGRGPRFDENAKNEAREKLQAFGGAQSISSSSYFGEEDQANQINRDRSASGTLQDFETSARDFASRFSGNANQDIDVLKDALEDGANKVGSYLRDFLR